jgi:hypothetical protein
MVKVYEALLKERIELYVEEIEKEIHENDKLINRYGKSELSKIEVLEYFKKRLLKIKNEFEITRKILNYL